MSRTTERVGRSGEYFVASLLSQISDTVLMVPHSAEADVLFQYNNTLYKVQVKTKTKIEKHRANWRFDMRRGSHTKNRSYENGAIDIFAFVSLEYMNVVFRKADDTSSVTIKDEEMQNNKPIDNILDILDKVHYTA
ncbi:MAG TPA: hypothetical protein VLB82_13070 [Thermodesulfobacteriota bacterium]|nr:hypothetical protein [Thermodesulfobacteriota bacterium]